MQELIGFFEIDPNRVLDVVLDAFEANALAAVKKSARLLLRRKLGWRRAQAMYTRVS